MTASSRLRLSSVLASGSVSTAERSEVSGFFSSCATSAAKLSIASMRRIERVGHVAQRAGQMADLVAAAREVGNLDARADAPAHALGGVGEPPHRAGDGAGEQERQHAP